MCVVLFVRFVRIASVSREEESAGGPPLTKEASREVVGMGPKPHATAAPSRAKDKSTKRQLPGVEAGGAPPVAPAAAPSSPSDSNPMAQFKALTKLKGLGGGARTADPFVWDKTKTPVDNVKEQLAHARLDSMKVFRKMDTDGNGGISRKEFRVAVPGLDISGEDGAAVGGELIDAVFSALDVNGDGSITFAEIEKTLRFRTQTGAVAELQALHRGRAIRKDIEAVCSAEVEKVLDMFIKNREPTLKLLRKVGRPEALRLTQRMHYPICYWLRGSTHWVRGALCVLQVGADKKMMTGPNPNPNPTAQP